LKDALSVLNQNSPNFVGVTQLPYSCSDEEIISLHTMGVRALRFNLRRGGSEAVTELERFALRVHQLVGWHVELYAGFDALIGLKSLIVRLPAVSIDHLGLESKSFALLQFLVGQGVKVKATGFGRLDFDAISVIKALFSTNPDALMFGTDLPSTRAPTPFDDSHLYALFDEFDQEQVNKICWENGREWYGL